MGLFDERFMQNVKKKELEEQEKANRLRQEKIEELNFLNSVYARFLLYVAEFPAVAKKMGKQPRITKTGVLTHQKSYPLMDGYSVSIDGRLCRVERVRVTTYKYKEKVVFSNSFLSPQDNHELALTRPLCHSFYYQDGYRQMGGRLNEQEIERNIRDFFENALHRMK